MVIRPTSIAKHELATCSGWVSYNIYFILLAWYSVLTYVVCMRALFYVCALDPCGFLTSPWQLFCHHGYCSSISGQSATTWLYRSHWYPKKSVQYFIAIGCTPKALVLWCLLLFCVWFHSVLFIFVQFIISIVFWYKRWKFKLPKKYQIQISIQLFYLLTEVSSSTWPLRALILSDTIRAKRCSCVTARVNSK